MKLIKKQSIKATLFLAIFVLGSSAFATQTYEGRLSSYEIEAITGSASFVYLKIFSSNPGLTGCDQFMVKTVDGWSANKLAITTSFLAEVRLIAKTAMEQDRKVVITASDDCSGMGAAISSIRLYRGVNEN